MRVLFVDIYSIGMQFNFESSKHYLIASFRMTLFGSGFCAMQKIIEHMAGLCYNLRMLEISVEEPVFVFW